MAHSTAIFRTVGITLDNLQAMLDGDLAPATGFMAGKLRVTGDLGVAMNLLAGNND